MNSGFIAALLVMILLTAFTFFILRMVAASTGDKIRDNVITQVKSYDALIQKKEAELQEIRKQIEHETKKLKNNSKLGLNQDQPAQDGVIITADARYRNVDFATDYKNIKNQFSFDQNMIIQEIYLENKGKQDEQECKLLDDLLSKLSLDIVYKLSAFDSEEQMEIMNDIVTEEEKGLMEEFRKQYANFHCINFYHWLYLQQKIKCNTILVKSSKAGGDYKHISDSIEVQQDNNLCEGFQIFAGRKMYDYGIRRLELI
ncbi:MAG: hypothetical protein QM644_15315 [Mobilitalea sp.]